MNKRLLFLFLSVFSVSAFLTSCGEDDIEGCTDPQSNNFNAEATVDDGTCTFDRDQFLGDWFGSIVFPGNLSAISSDSISFTIDTGIDPEDRSSVNVTFTNTALAGISSAANVDGNNITFASELLDFPITLDGLGTINADINVSGALGIMGNDIEGTIDASATPTGTTISIADTGTLMASKQ